MTTIVISRTGGTRPSSRTQKPSLLARISEQAIQACRQFFDQVDIDHTRNQIKHLPLLSSLHSAPKEQVAERKRIIAEFGLINVTRCVLKNKWERFRHQYIRKDRVEPKSIEFRFPRERLLCRVVGLSILAAVVSANTAGSASPTFVMDMISNEGGVFAPKPVSWLDGEAEAKGSRDAVIGAHSYATTAGYTFAADASDREQMVADGTLVKLDGTYIDLVDVSEPYVMPAVARFVNRLGELHAARGCGKLVVTSALRTLEHQGTLSNGSNYSVHPTGMSIDLRRPTDEASFCSTWLKDTLLEIEAAGRIDMTAENAPRHYHIVVLPNEYSTWLARQPQGLDPEVKWLAIALHFEGGPNESLDGYRAIGWVIKNRTRSEDFPNTIVEVVAEGAAGRSAGGCQFSFMCDGKAEKVETPCAQSDEALTEYQRTLCVNRWNTVVGIAKEIVNATDDPTNGSVLYYAASMPQTPYWARPRTELWEGEKGKMYKVVMRNGDFKPGTIDRIGNHIFGCSRLRGAEVCEV
jgi:spore germination cell wall hydrolase CwlJ-like protein